MIPVQSLLIGTKLNLLPLPTASKLKVPYMLLVSMTGDSFDCLQFLSGLLNTLDLMYLLIVFLPLLGSSLAGFFGRFLGSEGTAIITTTLVSLSSIFSLIAFYEVALGASACYIRISPWISLEMFDASWGFFGDREVTGGIAE